jgi:diguanylate cyclase (GGDEF)-like protein
VPAASTHRRAFLVAAIVAYAFAFVGFVFVETPDLGLPHFFYVPIVLVAAVTGPLLGFAAGALAAALYCIGVLVHPVVPPAEVLTIGTLIRLAAFSGTGAVVGWFASDNRRLVDQLRILAERDGTTGLPNTRAFETAIQRRLDSSEPFALLIGDMAALTDTRDGDASVAENDALLRLSEMLGSLVRPEDDLARVGGREFAVLARTSSSVEASRLSAQLEHALAANGIAIRFGWAMFPQEGQNALSLYRAADERLYARKLVGNALRTSPGLRSVG